MIAHSSPFITNMQPLHKVANTYAYLTKAGGYAALNEYQVGLAESTCVAKLQGSSKGKLNIVDLSAIALERSKTARDAIQVCI